MDELIRIGKKRTILISISILLVSFHAIYLNQSSLPDFDSKKLLQQSIRFLLTVGLLFMVYKGKEWARNLLLILFSLALIVALFSIFTLNTPIQNKVPFMVMSFIYAAAVYHFGFSMSFKAFFNSQNTI